MNHEYKRSFLLDGLLANLTERQREAVCCTEGPLLVVAGPGSGKTRVITTRVAYLISGGTAPSNILCLTFTNKAADEMRERVEASAGTRGAWLSTFHSMCSRLLRMDLDLEGYSRNFTIYDRSDQLSCLRNVLKSLNIDQGEAGLTRLPGRISAIKNGSANPVSGDEKNRDFSRIFAAYEKALQAANALDFDDLLVVFLKMLKSRPEILEKYRDRFRYVLVDEYQDTNRLQYEIVMQISEKHRNICVTGDPDQSIYSWRGADIRNILDFRKSFPEARVVLLEQNFRSTAGILKAAGNLIARNRKREEKSLIPVLGEGLAPRVVSAFDPEDEALRIAEAVSSLSSGGAPLSETAVFYRTNAQSRAIEQALLDRGIPYVIVGSVEFFQRREIKDLSAYLKIAVNPKDDVSFLRICNVPARGMGDKALDMVKGAADSSGASMFEAAVRIASDQNAPPRIRKALGELSGAVASLADFRGGVGGAVGRLVEALRYAEYLGKAFAEDAEDRVANVTELISACHEWDEKHPGGTLADFLEEVSLLSDVDKWDRKDAVSLMTLHSSKGLEFDTVVIAGMEEGLLPHFGIDGASDSDRIEEERRLCFVGMTRAKRNLIVTWAKNRRTARGDIDFGEPSRFLRESGLAPLLAEVSESRMTPYPSPGRAGPGTEEGDEDLEFRDSLAGEAEDEPFKTGDYVKHLSLGPGRVVATKGFGCSAKVVVNFPRLGLKTFAVGLAPLIRVNPDE